MKKGISLPIEMIVIIAVAVLVLVVIAAFFIGGAGKLSTTGDADAFGRGCQILRNLNCPLSSVSSIAISGYTPSGGAPATLATACQMIRPECLMTGVLDDACCRMACGCSA